MPCSPRGHILCRPRRGAGWQLSVGAGCRPGRDAAGRCLPPALSMAVKQSFALTALPRTTVLVCCFLLSVTNCFDGIFVFDPSGDAVLDFM